MDHRVLAQLQHAIQYPSGHLDRFARFGPAFEMGDQPTMIDPQNPHDIDDPIVRERVRVASLPAERPAVAETTAETTAPETGAQLAQNAIRRFVLAGRAIFTLQGTETRYTFRVNRKDAQCRSCKADLPDGARKCPACDTIQQYPAGAVYFVALLTGPDNLEDYTYAGILDVRTGTIRITRASKYTDDSKPVRAFNWAMARAWRDQPIVPAVFYHIGRCGRCGRALTVPSSIETGLGPECAGKVGA